MTAWWHWAALFAGGGVGACLRYALALRIDRLVAELLPHAGTLVVNLAGCLLIGACGALLPFGTARVVVLAGLLGGFTTYSTFALLTVELTESGRWGALALQLGLHVGGGALMVALGAWLAGLAGATPRG